MGNILWALGVGNNNTKDMPMAVEEQLPS